MTYSEVPGTLALPLSLLQKLEFSQNLTELRLASLRNGNSNMTLDEINAEIAASRVERRNAHDKT